MLPELQQQIQSFLNDALTQIGQTNQQDVSSLPVARLERPKVAEHGDLATNIAMQLAKPWKMNPKDLAQQLLIQLQGMPQTRSVLEKLEIAGPGFINIRFTGAVKQAVVQLILQQKNTYGVKKLVDQDKVLIEFVSANPTGPLHVGHGRQAALGDIVYIQLPKVGSDVAADKVCGEVESTKSVSEIYAPITGKIVLINEKLEANPEVINSDPYGGGWIAEIEISTQTLQDQLLSAQDYQNLTA